MADYRPRHQAQLNAGVAVPGKTRGSRDCGPRSWSVGVDFQTRGQKVPSITEIRDRADREGPQRTGIYDAQKAIQSYDRIRGRRPLRFYIKSFIADVKSAMAAGKYVVACIDYGTFNRLAAKTGDPNYMDAHSIGMVGQRTSQGEVQWFVYDSLDDQRRAGIPDGPRWIDREIVVRSMEAYARANGRCWAGVLGGGQRR